MTRTHATGLGDTVTEGCMVTEGCPCLKMVSAHQDEVRSAMKARHTRSVWPMAHSLPT